MSLKYCKACVYPESAVNILFDSEGICSACRFSEEYNRISEAEWAERQERLYREITEAKGNSTSRGNYDCIIAVSGGKDSYWQTHVIKNIFGLNPLLVTYHGNNYLPEGQRNLDNMKRVFDCSHIIFYPGSEKIIKLNRAAFKLMGDMNWHAHAGIKTLPMQIAVALRIPIVIWGEVTWSISGMFSAHDFVEYNYRTVKDHDLRGYNYKDFLGQEDISISDVNWLEMPTDKEIAELGLRGLYVGNYLKWNPNEHTELVQRKYGFEVASVPFQRTYRNMSNLDDMHENGIHDYLKYLKFGYGRVSDHVSKDIRDGYLSRTEGVDLVRKYDHVFPSTDLSRWLTYVGMSANEFTEISERFRNKIIWKKNEETLIWEKDEIWDEQD